MPTPSPQSPFSADWRQQLAQAIREPRTLLQRLQLPMTLLPSAESAARLFPLRVPKPWLARIRPGDPDDPLLRQVLPLQAEHEQPPGFTADPVGDGAAEAGPGLLHKYHGRVLLITTGACAIHCRYCFRRHFPYAESQAGREGWAGALRWLDRHPEVDEVILSGGDPLTLSDRRLALLTEALRARPQVGRLRLHTRLPIVLPDRITEALIGLLDGPWEVVWVIHSNHAQELDESVATALSRLQAAGHWLLNQAVLLRRVNDDVDALEALSRRLFRLGVLPYYLHLLDRVQGAAHFEVAEPRARALMADLAGRLPGYLLPRLVREEPGEPAKTGIAPLADPSCNINDSRP